MTISQELLQVIFGTGLLTAVITAVINKRKTPLDKADLITDNAVSLATSASAQARQALEQVEKLSSELAEVKQTNEELRTQNRRIQSENNRIIDDIRIMINAWQKHLPNVRPPIDPKNYMT